MPLSAPENPMPDSFHPAIFILFFAIWVGLAVAMGFAARSKGYSMAVGITIALLTSFVSAFIIITILPDRTDEARTKKDAEFKLRVEFEKARQRMLERARAAEEGKAGSPDSSC